MPEGCSYLMIHDSFGTLCADAPEFAKVIRETFIEMYAEAEPLREFFNETMNPVLLEIGMCTETVTIERLEEMVSVLKGPEHAKKRAIGRKVLKVLKNIEPTNDMDFDVIRDCRYSFR